MQTFLCFKLCVHRILFLYSPRVFCPSYLPSCSLQVCVCTRGVLGSLCQDLTKVSSEMFRSYSDVKEKWSGGKPSFLFHHCNRSVFVSNGRGWVVLLLIILVDWKWHQVPHPEISLMFCNHSIWTQFSSYKGTKIN